MLGRPQSTVRWEASDAEDGANVAIDLHYRVADGQWVRIAFNLPNSGTHPWTLAGVPTSNQVALRLTARDREGGARQIVVEPLTVTDLPVADFVFEPAEGITTEADVRFIDRSTDADGAVAGWRWQFRDGATSTEQNPTHRYAGAGVYDVSLVAVDDLGAPSVPARQTLAVGTPEAPVVGFTYKDTQPGDDTLDALETVGLLVTKSGDGTPRLSAARFDGYPVPGPGLQTAAGFFDLHLDGVEGVVRLDGRWYFPADFEDPGQLVLIWFDPQQGHWVRVEPQAVIVAPGGGFGGYIAFTLDATSAPRLDQLTGTLFGAVVNRAPHAAFTAGPEAPTVLDTVRFTDASTDPDGNLVAWAWEFGDGQTSTERNPQHQYARKGTYTVRLTVTDAGGATATAQQPVQVANLPPEVKLLKPEAGAIWTGIQTIEYEATDADGDPLTLSFAYRPAGSDVEWQAIAQGQPNTGKFPWNTALVKRGGRYQVRVTAGDGEASGSAESEPFIISVVEGLVAHGPNPARDAVTFYFNIQDHGAELHIFRVDGRPVARFRVPRGTTSMRWDLTDDQGRPLASGLHLYVLVTESGDSSKVGRLLIER